MTPVLLSSSNPFQAAAGPIVELINMAAGPLLMIVAGLGVIYCIILGGKLGKAEGALEREKARGAVKDAIIGFVLIFVLIAALNLMLPALTSWMNTSADTDISIDFDGGSN